MQYIIFFLLTIFFCDSAYSETTKPIVILLSIDGFSYDYLQKHQPKNLLSLSKSGINGKLLPVYPSKTFPNHLSIITGTYPVKHGIVNNNFFNPLIDKYYYKGAGKNNSAWLTADPFWSTAEKQGIKTAVYFWPESEIKGRTPSFNIPFNKKDSNKARFDQLLKWLKLPIEQRPQFIASYFSSVDSAGHHYGPNSKELKQSITDIDLLIGDFISKLPETVTNDVSIIVVSDHGMLELDTSHVIKPSMVFDEKILNLIKSNKIKIAKNDTQIYLYFSKSFLHEFDSTKIIEKLNEQSNKSKLYQVHSKGEYPKHWNFNIENKLIPDIIIEANPPAVFVKENFNIKRLNKGTHGYDAKGHSGLIGIFIASGQNIIKGQSVKPFENIHVFPFMSELLMMKQTEDIDGNSSVLAPYIIKK